MAPRWIFTAADTVETTAVGKLLRAAFACQDAVCHVARIHRVLSLTRGNLMLVGVGGSGRQSLTRLASYIVGYDLFMIEITKNYRKVMRLPG